MKSYSIFNPISQNNFCENTMQKFLSIYIMLNIWNKSSLFYCVFLLSALMIFYLYITTEHLNKCTEMKGTWVAQLTECLTSAQVMTSRFMDLSPMLGSVLTAQSLEPAAYSVSPSLFVPPLLVCACSLSLFL